MDNVKYDPSTIPVTIHPDAVYTSRILKSTNLPQPRNSNKVTIISNNYGNYLTYSIQHHHYWINFILSLAKITFITSHSFH